MKKCKVLLVAYNNMGKGGIQSQIMGIVRSLKEQVDFHVVVWDNAKDYYSPEMDRYGVKIIRCFRNIGNNALRRKMDAFIRYGDIYRIMEGVIRENGPYDAIHCNNAYDAAPCLDAAYRAGIPIRISHAHNTENPNLKKKRVYPAYQMLYGHNRKIIHKYATHMIGCSKQVTDYFFGKNVGQVVHIGVDLTEFSNIQFQKKKSEKIQLLHVGSMSEQKNQLFLMEVMEELIKIREDVHLVLIGGGAAYLDRVKRSIAQKKLDDYVTIMPPETNIPQAMMEADLFLFPSTFEGFGIVLIEAQAQGLECIVSDIVSPEANCGGICYLPLETGASFWARTIAEKIEAGLGQKTKYDIREFSVKKMSERIYGLYTGCIK